MRFVTHLAHACVSTRGLCRPLDKQQEFPTSNWPIAQAYLPRFASSESEQRHPHQRPGNSPKRQIRACQEASVKESSTPVNGQCRSRQIRSSLGCRGPVLDRQRKCIGLPNDESATLHNRASSAYDFTMQARPHMQKHNTSKKPLTRN